MATNYPPGFGPRPGGAPSPQAGAAVGKEVGKEVAAELKRTLEKVALLARDATRQPGASRAFDPSVVARADAAILALAGRMAKFGEAIQAATGLLAGAAGKAAAAGRYGVTAAAAAANAPFQGAAAGVSAAMPLAQFGKAVEAAAAPMQAVTAAAWGLMRPFQQLAGSVRPFMDALSPALSRELEYSLRELMASVGLLVQPIAQELGPLLREVAASLQPAFRALQPVMAELAQTVGRVVALLARTFVDVLRAFQPTLQAVVEVFGQLMTALSPLVSALGSLLSALAPLFTALAQGLTPILASFARALTYATAGLLKFFGANEALGQMIRTLRGFNERGPQSAGLQAAQNVQFSDPLAYGRQLALAATLAARPGQERRTDNDLLRDMLTNLESIRDGDTWGPLVRELERLLNAIGKAIVDGIKSGVYESPIVAPIAGALGVSNIGTFRSNSRTFIDQAADWWFGVR